MKKILLTLMFLLMTSSLFASIENFGVRFQVGVIPLHDWAQVGYIEQAEASGKEEKEYMGEYIRYDEWKYGFADLYVEYRFNVWMLENKIYGNWRTIVISRAIHGTPGFFPFRDIYGAGLQTMFNGIFINLEHFCNHPVYSGEPTNVAMHNRYVETMTTFSVGFDFNIDNRIRWWKYR